jgi:hypothetical protein
LIELEEEIKRRIIGTKRETVRGRCRKLHTKQLYILHMFDVPPNTTNFIQMSVLHINRVMKSSR